MWATRTRANDSDLSAAVASLRRHSEKVTFESPRSRRTRSTTGAFAPYSNCVA